VTLHSVPWIERKKHTPLIQHRPGIVHFIHPSDLARNLGYRYFASTNYEDVARRVDEDPGLVMIGGANILPARFVETLSVINSHPGMLPEVRGLDAFKWAIHDELDLGVTTHLAGKDVDTGRLIAKRKNHLQITDTFHTAAQRHYDIEIKMLIESISIYAHKYAEHLKGNREWETLGTQAADYVEWHSKVRKRMPATREVYLHEMLKHRIMKECRR
jgi:phosphoribosylglycinamide formyltransferase-1